MKYNFKMRIAALTLLFLCSSPGFASLQSACFPDPNDDELVREIEQIYEQENLGEVGDMRTWPIGAIYLHGWDNILEDGSADELANRERLKELAKQMARRRLRIALPVSGQTRRVNDGRTVFYWPGQMPLQENEGAERNSSIEGLARLACSSNGNGDDVDLASPRVLMGYSNGAYKAINLAESLNCRQGQTAGAYTRIIAIGARESSNSCGTLRTNAAHSPRNFAERLDGFLDGWDDGIVWSSPRPVLRRGIADPVDEAR
ncbi:MAG: hypothetical protein HRT45_10710 [Bdellovibrionales bacterium]|nr:hypothetical protein [Bdellovibrionales bacterium]